MSILVSLDPWSVVDLANSYPVGHLVDWLVQLGSGGYHNSNSLSAVAKEYDDWLQDEDRHTFTRGGKIRAPTKTHLCNMMVRSWDKIPEENIVKSFRVCGQVEDLDIDEIVAFQDGRVAADGKKQLEELLRLDPKDIDYGLLQKQHEETVVAEVLEQAEDTDTNTNEMDYDPLAMMHFDFDFE